MLSALVQVVLSLSLGSEPVRFGTVVPVRALRDGLSLRGPGQLSWRVLPLAAAEGRAWVELSICGCARTARVQIGGESPPAVVVVRDAIEDGTTAQPCVRTEWRWQDGSLDRRERVQFAVDTELGGEVHRAGEFWSEESDGLPRRCLGLLALPSAELAVAGVLPPRGRLAAELREHVRTAARAMVELPGRRGRGDYGRSGAVVTNLEFDTALGLLRLGLSLGDEELLLRARRAALHLVDRDLDARTGLPFRHGLDHRSGTPEPGHAWLQGLLWVGALTADDELLAAARQLARAIAASPPVAEREGERARDYAWPLFELESFLALCPDAVVRAAADRMALALFARWRPDLHTFCFGEGAFTEGDGYFERAWLTGGVVLPALRAHLVRRPDPEIQRAVDDVTQGLLARIGQGRGGLPTHFRVVRGAAFAEHRAEHDPKAFLLLEGLPEDELRQLLRKGHVLRSLAKTPALDDPDLATSVSTIARCTWLYR